jgi:hypothetical protein
MKVLAVILSIYILALSVSICPDACSAETSECQTEQRDCCSPFSLCNTCAGFVIADITDTEIRLQELSAEMNLSEQHIYTDIFLDSIWQPPKLAV